MSLLLYRDVLNWVLLDATWPLFLLDICCPLLKPLLTVTDSEYLCGYAFWLYIWLSNHTTILLVTQLEYPV